MSAQLQRLVIDFTREGLEIRTLYRSKGGPNPETKARRREATALAMTGLRDALEALEGRVDLVGTSGYEVREDTLSLPRPDEPSEARRAAS